jgi:hypothetical protein
VVDGGGVAASGLDAQTEQVGQPADVSVGGVGFVEDAVLADVGGGQLGTEGPPDPLSANRPVAVGGSHGHEEVGVVGVRPAGLSVVQVRGQRVLDERSERDTAPPSRCSDRSRTLVSRSCFTWLARSPWKAMSAATAACAGLSEFRASRRSSRSTGSG